MTVWKCSWNQTNREPACLSCVDKWFRTERNKLWFGAFNISMLFFAGILFWVPWLGSFVFFRNSKIGQRMILVCTSLLVTQRNAHIVAVRDSMTHQYSNHDSPDLWTFDIVDAWQSVLEPPACPWELCFTEQVTSFTLSRWISQQLDFESRSPHRVLPAESRAERGAQLLLPADVKIDDISQQREGEKGNHKARAATLVSDCQAMAFPCSSTAKRFQTMSFKTLV